MSTLKNDLRQIYGEQTTPILIEKVKQAEFEKDNANSEGAVKIWDLHIEVIERILKEREENL